MVRLPRIIIAGTHSGVGKTTVAMGLIAALRRRGVNVQPFKVGPDYIDPSHLERAAACPARNLDTWLVKPEMVRALFIHAARPAGLSVIEGVMGLFDGYGGTTDRGSTAEVATLLATPVVLVVDASHLARSVAALVKGYREFDPSLTLAGVILNKVSERHAKLLRQSLRPAGVRVLGYLPSEPSLTIPERHLGLIPASEQTALAQRLERLTQLIQTTVDVEQVMRAARRAPALPDASPPWGVRAARDPIVRVGIAKDRAFHFYYHDNLDLLRASGAELVPFSPLGDRRLPDDLDGLYLGGGFPEVFAQPLSANHTMRTSIKRAVAAGMPVYAECGGFMYLTQRLIDAEDRSRPMVGVVPGTIRMTKRLQPFGYATIIPRRATILARAHDRIKGHEFHYSAWDHPLRAREAAYTIVRRGVPRRLEGFARENLLASYLHVHFLTNVRWARGFVAAAHQWKQQQRRSRRVETP